MFQSFRLSARRARAIVVLAALAPVGGFAAGANVFVQHNLVSDIPGMADVTDPNLVNPWGVSLSPASPFWVSNQGKGNSTLYNGSGTIIPLVVTIPAGAATTGQSKPTGQVRNNFTNAFLMANGKPASFIFATQDGTISAWNAGTTATLMVDKSSSGAVYFGLAIGQNSSGPLLYAPNFKTGAIDVFDGKFAPTTVPGGFIDPNLPEGYAPFNAWQLGTSISVAYAQQNASKTFSAFGVGTGVVDVFDMNGNLTMRLATNGLLNAPWGMAIAPATFGAFPGAFLVGNFGDGMTNAYDPLSGNWLGTLEGADGKPIVLQGLWALVVGNGAAGGDKNTVYFSAGIRPGGVEHGLFGSLAPPSAVLTVWNAASEDHDAVSPGEVILLRGLTIGPSPLAAVPLPLTSPVGTTFKGVTVTFNGTPAPILYASASATAVVVPYEVDGAATADIVVSYRNVNTAAFTVPVAATAPGVFTLNQNGTGPAVAFNADGSLNSAAKPAAAGSVVTFFATGEGVTTPAGQDGVVASAATAHKPNATVTLMIGGQPATVNYAGSSPGKVLGVMEVQAVVPDGAGTGARPVALTVGGVGSLAGPTIWLK